MDSLIIYLILIFIIMAFLTVVAALTNIIWKILTLLYQNIIGGMSDNLNTNDRYSKRKTIK